MRECPRCSSSAIHRSHARSVVERLRRGIDRKRLFRCHQCGWRGWGVPVEAPLVGPPDRGPVDLERLDADLRSAIEKLDASLDAQ